MRRRAALRITQRRAGVRLLRIYEYLDDPATGPTSNRLHRAARPLRVLHKLWRPSEPRFPKPDIVTCMLHYLYWLCHAEIVQSHQHKILSPVRTVVHFGAGEGIEPPFQLGSCCSAVELRPHRGPNTRRSCPPVEPAFDLTGG